MPDPQAQSQNDLRRLYGVASQVFNVGDFDTFRSKISDPVRRRKFYDSIQATGKVNLGAYDLFSGKVDAGLTEGQPPIIGKPGRIASVEDLLAGKNRPEVVEADKHNIPPSPEIAGMLNPWPGDGLSNAQQMDNLLKMLPVPQSVVGKQFPRKADEESIAPIDRSTVGSLKRSAAGIVNLIGSLPAGFESLNSAYKRAVYADFAKRTGRPEKEVQAAIEQEIDRRRKSALEPAYAADEFAKKYIGAQPGWPQSLETLRSNPLEIASQAMIENIPQSALFAGATAVDPLLGVSLMYAAEAGETSKAFADLEKSGVKINPVYRDYATVAKGALNSALEKTGVDKILEKAGPGAKGVLLKLLGTGATEGGTEWLQELNGVIAETGAQLSAEDGLSLKRVFDVTLNELIKNNPRLEQAAISGAFGGIGTGAAVEGVRNLAEKFPVEQSAAKEQVGRSQATKPEQPVEPPQTPQAAQPAAPAKKSPVIISLADEPDAESPAVESAAPAVNDEQKETVAKSVFGKSFAELSQPQKNLISKKIAEAAAKDEDARVSAAVKNLFAPKDEKKAAPPSTPPTQPESAPPIAQQATPAEVAPKVETKAKPATEAPAPPIERTSLPVPAPEQEKPEAVAPAPSGEATQTEKRVAASVQQLPITDIATDVDRFQSRASDFSEKTAATVAERYDPNLFDPIVVWRDPANGKTFVLSGHSRLEGMKRRGEKNIPARYFDGDEQAAMNYAQVQANRLGTAENLSESIKAYRTAKAQNLSRAKLKDLFDGDLDFLDAAQNLDQEGDFINILNQSARDEFPHIKRFSRYVGELRGKYADKLTDRHEQQIFDWLYKGEKKNVDTSKDAFFNKVETQVDRLDFSPDQPLVLKRGEVAQTGTRGRTDTAALERELDQLREDRKKARTPQEVDTIDKEIARISKGISGIVKTQPDLFSAAEEEPVAPTQPKTEPVAESAPTKPEAPESQPTAKNYDRAVEIFNRVIDRSINKPTEAQQEAVREELEAAGIHPIIVQELTEPKRSPRPDEADFPEEIGIGDAYDFLRKVESKQYATTRKGRIESAIDPPAELKSKVDAIADAGKAMVDAEASLEQAKKDIIGEIEKRGGEVVVNTDTGAFTIKLNTGKAKMGLQDILALKKLRQEAAEAGAYSLATVGRGFEIAVTPEKVADAKPLTGTFAEKAKEFIRRNQAEKEAGKALDAAKKEARNELVDHYLAERAAEREPRSFKGTASDGTAAQVLIRRNRSAVEPDIAAGGRDFPAEIQSFKEEAATRSERGNPFISTRETGKKTFAEALKAGRVVNTESPKFGANNTIVTREQLDDAFASLAKKVKVNIGIDPSTLPELLKIGTFYVEGGIREFGAWSDKMVAGLTERVNAAFAERVKPNLKVVWDEIKKRRPGLFKAAKATTAPDLFSASELVAAQNPVAEKTVATETTPTEIKTEKEPWEMTQVYVASEKAKNDFPIDSKVEIKIGKPVYSYWTTLKWDGADRTFSIEGRSQPNGSEMASRLHKKVVEAAISEGKPVSANVLADYPDLAKLAKSETVATPKPEPPKNILQVAAQKANTKADSELENLRVNAENTLIEQRGFHPNDAKDYVRRLEGGNAKKNLAGFIADNTEAPAEAQAPKKESPNILQQAAKAATESNKLSSDIVATKFGGTLPDGRKLVAKNIATRNGVQQGYVKDNANREIVEYKANGAQRFAVIEMVAAAKVETPIQQNEIEKRSPIYGDWFKSSDGDIGILRGSGGLGSSRVKLVDEEGTLIGYYNRNELKFVGYSEDGKPKSDLFIRADQTESETPNAPSIDRDLEPTGARATTGDQVGERVVPAESRRIREKGQRGVRETTEDLFAPSGRELSADEAATGREQSDSSPFAESPGTERRTAGDQFGERSGDSGVSGAAIEPVAAKAVARSSEQLSPFSAKVIAQGKAENIPVEIGNRANIDETLPFLKDGQRDDVAFAEKRFAKSDGYGVMFTNGTGTGKTFSGLGIIKRMAKIGKDNIVIVVPSDKIAYDWVERGKLLKLNIKKLDDTKDNGRRGVVVTTYANFGQNTNLAKRNWDAVVLDEAHYLMQAKQGSSTNALDTLRAISLHPRGAYARAARLHPELYEKLDDFRRRKIAAPQELYDQLRKVEDATKDEVAAAQGEKRPRVVFLSATPFAYEKAVDYAEGFLFDYPPVNTGARYNQPSGSDQFMVQHFGYRMRYNKLTEPDKDVDRGLMQRTFNSWLKQQGVLSGRRLDVDADYDRRFILSETKVGHAIDEGLQWLWDRKRMQPLRDIVAKQFDHLSRRYLLEAIKANEVIKPIKANLAAGRKVVVFHDFKKGGAFNPFDIRVADDNPTIVYYTDESGKRQDVRLKTLVDEFREARPDLISLPIASLPSPIVGLTKAFPDAMVFNGDIPKAERIRIVNKFQDDNSGKDLIIVQAAAGKEGISLHDTTGKKPRILFNLGLPTQPTTSIQQEGRIYREGQASNAMFRYLNTGTNWERFAFAETIAQRSSAAENLALGVEARALLDSFIQAYEQSDTYPVGHEGEGIGGKLGDKEAESMLTDWDRAISMYFAQQKKTSRTKAQEGTDYFATPEPLGQKMVEWANIRPGDAVLEPSAGHGAIARWFPDLTPKTVIEPSAELASRLKMVAPDARLVQERFEDFHIVNKYDVIVMNPPFGVGGKTAMEHLEKASQHLKDGGRIVAIIPRGGTADKRFDKWMYGEDSKGFYLAANIELPAVTFERAGTKTSARVVVIDKIENRDVARNIQQQDRDYSDAETIKDFFDRIENSSVQPRVDAAEIAGEVEAPKQPVVSLTEIADTATQQQSEYGYPIAEHTTATGKLLRGTIRTDISYQTAKNIDRFTFRKNNGFYIREKNFKDLASYDDKVQEIERNVAEKTTLSRESELLGAAADKSSKAEIEEADAAVKKIEKCRS